MALRQFLAAVADIDAPHAGGPVDQPLAVAVGDVDAVAFADQGARFGADRAGIRPGLDQMALGEFDGIVTAKSSAPFVPSYLCAAAIVRLASRA